MSKRGADEYITKEHGSTPNQRDGEESRKMATAAQLAKRKIAQPKSRMARNAPSASGSAAPVANPFNSMNSTSQSQQTFGSVNGMVFGAQSQSFPPTNSASNAGNSFNFSAPGQNNPFATVTANTPFTNPNGNASFSGTNGNASGMFGGGIGVNGDDVSMESPEKKQQTSFAFGSQSHQQPPAAPAFNFSASQNPNPNKLTGGLFASQGAQATAPNGLFGAVNKGPEKKDEQPSGALFGQANAGFGSTKAQQSMFSAGQQSSNFNFGASSQATATSTSPAFSFGEATGTSKALENGASTPFKFGGAIKNSQPATPISFGSGNAPATAPPKSTFNIGGTQSDHAAGNLFGAPQTEKPADSKATTFVFGQTASTQTPGDQSSTTSTPAFSFGGTSTFGAPKPSEDKPVDTAQNVFSSIAPLAQPAKPPATPKNSFLFGAEKMAPDLQPDKDTDQPKNPFSSLSSAQPLARTVEADTHSTSPFPFPAATTSFGTTSPAPSQPSKTPSLFGNFSKPPPDSSNSFSNFGKPAESSKEAPASNEEGGDAPASDAQDKVSNVPAFRESTLLSDTLCPVGRPAKHVTSVTLKNIPTHRGQISEQRRKELFGHIPRAAPPLKQFASNPTPNINEPLNPTEVQDKEGSPPFSSIHTSGKSSVQAPVASSSDGSKKRLFDSYRSDTLLAHSDDLASVNKPNPLPPFGSSSASAPAAPKPTTTGQLAKKPVFNQAAASSVPGHLNSDGYQEFDNQDKLRALNREFRKKIMAVDVATHDLDTLLRVYIAARSSIGADLGLYHRTVAGTKRRNDHSDDSDVPSAYKKARSDGPDLNSTAQPASGGISVSSTGPSVQSPEPTRSATNNIFGNPSQTSKTTAPSPMRAIEQNRASQMLHEMIPKSPDKTASQPQQSPEKSKNVFGGVRPLPAAGGSLFGSPSKAAESSASDLFKPAFGQSNTSTTPSKPTFGFQPSTTPAKSPPKASGFRVSGAVADGFSAFGQKAETGAKKRRAEQLEDEYSSSEESQAEGRKTLEERERAKKAKYESIAKTGFIPSFGAAPASTLKPSQKKNYPFDPDSSGSDEADDEDTSDEVAQQRDGTYEPDENDEDASEEDEEAEDEEEEAEDDAPQEAEEAIATDPSREPSPDQINKSIAENPNTGRSLFDRVSVPEKKADGTPNGGADSSAIMNSTAKPGWKTAPIFAGIGKSTPEQPAFSPFTPDPNYKPASTFNFNASTASSTDSTSVLGGAAAKVDPKFEGLFGSRPSTPSQADRPTNPPNGTPGDHTWKQGSPIKFGASTPDKNHEPPKFSFTAASPFTKDGADDGPRPFGSLFGKPAPNSAPKPDGNLGFSFGQSSTSPAPGFLSAAPHLGVGGSVTSSGISSRQSSPGLTDNESVATDVTDTDPTPPDEQAKYNESRAGEEGEETVYEVPTVKALRLANDKTATPKDPKGTWVTMGQGPLRLLKNKDGKTRIVVRNSTNGNVILNEYLQPKLAWSVQNQPNGKTGAVKGFIAQEGALNQWVMKLKLGREVDLTDALENERKAQDS